MSPLEPMCSVGSNASAYYFQFFRWHEMRVQTMACTQSDISTLPKRQRRVEIQLLLQIREYALAHLERENITTVFTVCILQLVPRARKSGPIHPASHTPQRQLYRYLLQAASFCESFKTLHVYPSTQRCG